jgi:hypothetical protein
MMAERALATAICAAALALAGCGGGGEESASSAPSTARQSTSAAPPPQHKSTAVRGKGNPGQGKAQAQGKAQGHSGQAEAKVRVPPISSAPVAGSKAPAPGVRTVKGGDNSVQSYGTEAGEAQRTEAAIALQAYLDARLAGEWAAVCSHLAQRARAQLDRFVSKAQSEGKDIAGCAAAMAALSEGTPPSRLREDATITEVLSLRGGGGVPGDPSYLIFTGPPDSTLYSMPMYLEGGEWKVGLALPSELPL